MAGSFPDAWEEVALVTISLFDASSPVNIECMAITESINIDEGEYGGEGVPTIAGGRVWKQSPHADGTITLELYPINLSAADNSGLFQWWVGGTIDASEPLASDVTWASGVSRERNRFRVAIMWTDDTAVADAMAATTVTDSVALRFAALGCRIISHNTDFTDGIMKTTVTFKYPQFSKSGTVKMARWESTNDGDTTPLPVLVAYDNDESWS